MITTGSTLALKLIPINQVSTKTKQDGPAITISAHDTVEVDQKQPNNRRRERESEKETERSKHGTIESNSF